MATSEGNSQNCLCINLLKDFSPETLNFDSPWSSQSRTAHPAKGVACETTLHSALILSLHRVYMLNPSSLANVICSTKTSSPLPPSLLTSPHHVSIRPLHCPLPSSERCTSRWSVWGRVCRVPLNSCTTKTEHQFEDIGTKTKQSFHLLLPLS